MRAPGICRAWLAAAGLWVVTPASGQDIDLRSMVMVRGTCERLIVAGGDRTASCHQVLTNLSYHSGRTSFAFVDLRGGGEGSGQMMISFSGIGAPAAGERGRLAIDMVSRAV